MKSLDPSVPATLSIEAVAISDQSAEQPLL